jgi:endonuclease/exonuclease/phosphatase family metal-dependent hydrolase
VTIRLLTYNIARGGIGREAALQRVIAGCSPDIAILQEATDPLVVERLAQATAMPHCAARRNQSLAFMSRIPIDHHEWHRPRFSRHAFLEIVPAGTSFRVFGVHLSAVHAAWTERRRTFELRALLKSIARHQTGFHALTGDFNTLAPGELLDVRQLPARLRALVWLSGGRVRFRTIKIVLEAGYADVFRTRYPTEPGYTFPTWSPHVRLDYLFVPGDHLGRVKECHVVTAPETRTASDHFPLVNEVEAPSI